MIIMGEGRKLSHWDPMSTAHKTSFKGNNSNQILPHCCFQVSQGYYEKIILSMCLDGMEDLQGFTLAYLEMNNTDMK